MLTMGARWRWFLRRLIFFVISAILCVSAGTPVPRTEPTVRNQDTGQYFLPDYGETLVAAHRAGKSNAPENTRMAVESCIAGEAFTDIIEIDLQCTFDGELVLFHDLYLDEKTNAVELFGRSKVTVFSKTFEELQGLNMGESFEVNGEYPYRGLRGDDIPDDLHMTKLEDVLDLVEEAAPGKFYYTMEIKYPFPWAPKMVDKLCTILTERQMNDRVIVASFWPEVSHFIDEFYSDKLMRSANPLEIIDFYGCFLRHEDLKDEVIPYMALQMPYYWRHGERLTLANLGRTELIDYAHRYGISVQYYTVERYEDMQDLCLRGADVLMTNRPDRAYGAILDLHNQENEEGLS